MIKDLVFKMESKIEIDFWGPFSRGHFVLVYIINLCSFFWVMHYQIVSTHISLKRIETITKNAFWWISWFSTKDLLPYHGTSCKLSLTLKVSCFPKCFLLWSQQKTINKFTSFFWLDNSQASITMNQLSSASFLVGFLWKLDHAFLFCRNILSRNFFVEKL